MTQAPEPLIPPAGPPPAGPPPVGPPPAAHIPLEARHTRLYQAAAWVVIVAGTIFVLAVVFFAGYRLSGHGPDYGRHHHGMFNPEGPGSPDGPPPYVVFPGGPFPPGAGPWGPWGPGMGPGGPGMGPGGPGGRGGHGGPGGPDVPPPPPPTYTP